MSFLIFGVCLLIGCILIVQWYVSASPKVVLRYLKYTAIFGLFAGGIVLFMTGLKVWAFSMLPVLLLWTGRLIRLAPVVMFLKRLFIKNKNYSRASNNTSWSKEPTGQTSQISTNFLEMELDHDTGEMFGKVLKGNFKGRGLGELVFEDLMDLLSECRDDEQSVQVLGAYLDRYHDTDWRDSLGENKKKSADGEMSRAQALDILGLKEEAGVQEIKKAHQRLMLQNHPDRGGSTFLASQINHAKDVLLDL